MGELFRVDYNLSIVDDSLAWSRELTLVEQYLDGIPLEESHADEVVVRAPPSHEFVDPTLGKTFDFIFIPSPLLRTNSLSCACIGYVPW